MLLYNNPGCLVLLHLWINMPRTWQVVIAPDAWGLAVNHPYNPRRWQVPLLKFRVLVWKPHIRLFWNLWPEGWSLAFPFNLNCAVQATITAELPHSVLALNPWVIEALLNQYVIFLKSCFSWFTHNRGLELFEQLIVDSEPPSYHILIFLDLSIVRLLVVLGFIHLRNLLLWKQAELRLVSKKNLVLRQLDVQRGHLGKFGTSQPDVLDEFRLLLLNRLLHYWYVYSLIPKYTALAAYHFLSLPVYWWLSGCWDFLLMACLGGCKIRASYASSCEVE